jgi:hypothetical protein
MERYLTPTRAPLQGWQYRKKPAIFPQEEAVLR